MKIVIFLVTALLAGCGTAPPATQIVEVPVYAPCLRGVPARPEYEFDKLSVSDSDGSKVLALARDWGRSMKYQELLEASLIGCP